MPNAAKPRKEGSVQWINFNGHGGQGGGVVAVRTGGGAGATETEAADTSGDAR